jgi:cytochrome c553
MESPRMSLRTLAVAITLAFALPSLAIAAEEGAKHEKRAGAGNPAAGKQKAGTCAACHGDGNKTLNDTYPKLAGQYPDYLSKALHEYKNGKRKNAIMGGMAKPLSEQDIADLAAYFGSLKPEIHDLSGHQR